MINIMRQLKILRATICALLVTQFISCIRRTPTTIPKFELSIYSGVEELVKLDDNESRVRQRSAIPFQKSELNPATHSDLIILRFTHILRFKNLGVRAYLRNGRVALIELQEPFSGLIKGKKLALFPFAQSSGHTWYTTIVQQFGTPSTHVSGGRLSSEALFYVWGDVAYNNLGPNEIGIYRGSEIAEYRKKNFGRMLQFFSTD